MVIFDCFTSTYFTENKRDFHKSVNLLVHWLIHHPFHGNFLNIMTGYRTFSRMFVKSFPGLSRGF